MRTAIVRALRAMLDILLGAMLLLAYVLLA